MLRFLVILALLISSCIFAQDSSKFPGGASKTPIEHSIGEKGSDSLEVRKALEAVIIQSGIDNFQRYQREQKAKQKKQAMIYFGLGIFFLVVLIVGLRRKIKK